MTVDRRAVETFFDRKLVGAKRVNGTRHLGFRVETDDGRVLLPCLSISRGSGGSDLSARNTKGLSDAMGLTLQGFDEACKCRVAADVVTFCAAVRVTADCVRMHQLDSIVYDDDWIRLIGSTLKVWLASARTGAPRRPTAQERKEVARALGRLEGLFASCDAARFDLLHLKRYAQECFGD